MQTTDQLNSTLSGRYAVDRLIGQGGMATVYLARDLRHNRKVALKVLRPDLGAVVGVERFLSEIQVTANLQHPNLLPLFDSGVAGELLFYVMPYIQGESLRARLMREKQLPVEEVVRLATAVGNALDYAHRHGVIHRDLKPENILLHEDQPLVADFGIALAVSNAGGNRITQTGLSLGTPQYMSPEQATGDRVIDGRTDIYSLGALTYEMLTGEPPHTGPTSQAIIARVLTDHPRSIRLSRPSVPEHIEVAVEHALEKLPADRWATAKEFSEAMSGARTLTHGTRTLSSSRGAARPAWREMLAWGIAAATTTLLVMGAVRALRTAPPPVRAEFDIVLPDSLAPRPQGSAAVASISRDGSTIVFVASRPGSAQQIFYRRLDDRTIHAVPGTDSARSPTASADGSELLYTSVPTGSPAGAGYPLKRVSIRGGVARTVVDSAAGNGQVSWRDTLLALSNGGKLFTASADGGPRTLLAAPDSGRGHLRYGFPNLLPDGRAALIAIWKGGLELDSVRVGIVTIPEGKVTEVGIHGTFPRYSPTGHLLYLTSDQVLNAVPFDARKRRVTGRAFRVAEHVFVGAGGAAAVSVADNGTIVYLASDARAAGERQFVAVSRSGVERSLGIPSGFHVSPRVSPDGRQIAMATTAVALSITPRSDIWRFDLGSRTMSRVTTDSQSVRPEWSPDGERIAFNKPAPDSLIWWRPLYASAPQKLFRVPNGRLREFSFSRAHGYAAFSLRLGATSTNDDIWVVHMDSLDSPHPVLSEPYQEYAPRMSPDGKLMAYITNRTGRPEVYVRAMTGPAVDVQVSTDGGTEPLWSRDGRELFYRGPSSVHAVRFSRTPRLAVAARQELFRDVYMRAGLINYDVLPSGELLMLRGAGSLAASVPLIVLTNWQHQSTARP